jgi:hypothetical protein
MKATTEIPIIVIDPSNRTKWLHLWDPMSFARRLNKNLTLTTSNKRVEIRFSQEEES